MSMELRLHETLRKTPFGSTAVIAMATAVTGSLYGIITSEWTRGNGRFNLRIEIPANSSATVYLPSSKPGAVTEGGRSIADVKGVTVKGVEHGHAVLNVQSGRYHFTAELEE